MQNEHARYDHFHKAKANVNPLDRQEQWLTERQSVEKLRSPIRCRGQLYINSSRRLMNVRGIAVNRFSGGRQVPFWPKHGPGRCADRHASRDRQSVRGRAIGSWYRQERCGTQRACEIGLWIDVPELADIVDLVDDVVGETAIAGFFHDLAQSGKPMATRSLDKSPSWRLLDASTFEKPSGPMTSADNHIRGSLSGLFAGFCGIAAEMVKSASLSTTSAGSHGPPRTTAHPRPESRTYPKRLTRGGE
jgi:hypothetical protein